MPRLRGAAFASAFCPTLQFAVERSHEALMREWRAQLDARAQELEQMQARLAPPRDLEQLKVQVRVLHGVAFPRRRHILCVCVCVCVCALRTACACKCLFTRTDAC
ncbi:hypothetical protein EON67_11880 [archaeon]|nr:MAG: hypothetical protein EON67_11880 [archaeon]